jgi:ankyrin repeat protein
MEPISVIASICGIAEAAINTLKALQIAVGAPDEIHALINDMSDFQVIVAEVHTALCERSHTPDLQHKTLPDLLALLRRANSKLVELNQIIQRRLKISDPKKNVPKSARIRWIQERSRVRAIQKELLEIKLNIAAMWGTANSIDLSRIRLQLENLLFITRATTATRKEQEEQNLLSLQQQHHLLAGLAAELKNHGLVQQTGHSSTEAIGLNIPSNTNPKRPGLASTGNDVSAGIKESLTARPETPASSQRSTAHVITGVCIQASKGACHPWCSCKCHKVSQFRTPAIINRLLGCLFVGYTSLPFLSPACTERRCLRQTSPSIHINFYFPSWFLMRVLSVMVTYSSSTGPEVLLRIPPVCPPNADIIFYSCTGNVRGLKSLFEKRLASPYDVEYGTGVSALHKAVDCRNIEAVQLLLSAGADPFLEDQHGWTPVSTICQHAFMTDAPHHAAFNDLLRTLHVDIFETLQFSVLHKTILGITNLDLETQLLASTSNIDAPDSSGQTPLFWASVRGDEAAVKTLLKYGANPNVVSNMGETPLHWSTMARNENCTRYLLEGGAEPNVGSCFGTSPLQHAAWVESDPSIHLEWLVTYGADVNWKNRKDQRPLHYAVNKDADASVAFLIDHGAMLEVYDNNGSTPLLDSLRYDVPTVTDLLLRRGANPLAKKENGDTLLHVAAANSSINVFKILSRHHFQGLNVDLRNESGMTPRDLILCRHDESHMLVVAFDQLLQVIREKEVTDDCHEERDVFEDALEYQDLG